ncbi:acetate kinase [Floricoccus tropicus]|uniref:Acetate kinase n=1 Tax=Floricoccus tropicus TaxID=1859473 RepID=A0A1E8GKD1_9LACT|nr:acetate kinase [Floricoccus tropicus]OFI48715.1 acetate kinase [Floricoccus tropicus]
MSKTIAINAGSSSLKWQLYEMPQEEVLAQGLIERVGLPQSISTVKWGDEKDTQTLDIPNHEEAVKILLDDLIRLGIISSYDEITGVGHRVVAGGEIFKKSTLIDDKVMEEIAELSELAPLHNPANLQGIKAFKHLLPNITSVAVFDTAFHTTMPEKAFRYPMPNKYYTDYSVRKYGAHGTSHQYVSQKAAEILGKDIKDLKIITCHLGNGGSITAVDGGKSVDTSMGFTPLAGIMMGTRSGDIDPSIFPYIISKDENLETAQDVVDMLNKQSGLLGISDISSDMRDVEAGIKEGNEKAILAYEMYLDRVEKYIGQYFAVLNGADAVVFTAGVGENAADIRERVATDLSWFGLTIDPVKNVRGFEGVISTDDAKVKVLAIPTDEELVIARDVQSFQN